MVRLLAFILTISHLSTACITPVKTSERYGIEPHHEGFVPSRIALMPCVVWPDSALRITQLPPTNRPHEELAELCESLDKFISDGFDNQPYMKGLSPKLVEKLYGASNVKPNLTSILYQEWKSTSEKCESCDNVVAIYNQTIKPRPSWQIWLNQLSTATKGSDALLIPLILSANARIEDDRGLFSSIRSAAVAALLVDTNNGSLIWSGGRNSEVAFKSLITANGVPQMKIPPLDDLKRRLFTEAIWLEFPGRQIYR